jgi:hypothetical protein
MKIQQIAIATQNDILGLFSTWSKIGWWYESTSALG